MNRMGNINLKSLTADMHVAVSKPVFFNLKLGMRVFAVV